MRALRLPGEEQQQGQAEQEQAERSPGELIGHRDGQRPPGGMRMQGLEHHCGEAGEVASHRIELVDDGGIEPAGDQADEAQIPPVSGQGKRARRPEDERRQEGEAEDEAKTRARQTAPFAAQQRVEKQQRREGLEQTASESQSPARQRRRRSRPAAIPAMPSRTTMFTCPVMKLPWRGR